MRTIGTSIAAALVIGVVTAARAAPALAQSAPATSSLQVDVFCGRDEAECLKQLAGMARRDGDHLRLMLANGQARTTPCRSRPFERVMVGS